MPVVLFSIEGLDNSSGAFQKAASGLGSLDTAYNRAAGSSAAYDRAQTASASSTARLESAAGRAQAAALRQAESLNRAADATARYRSAMDALNGATGDTTALQIRAVAAFSDMVGAQTRAAEAGLRTADSYTRLAAAQDLATRNEERLRAIMDKPMKGAGGGSGGSGASGGGESGIGGAVKNVLLYGLAYQLGSDIMSQFTQGFTRALDTQRTLAMTGATTGISTQTQKALGTYVNTLAGSGTQPFTSDILATGLYAIPSAGVTNKGAIEAINKQAVMFSAFTGSTDTQAEANALIQTMSAYGVKQSQMAQQAQKFQDVITGVVNLGILQPNEVAPTVTTFASTAAQYGVPLAQAAGEMAALTYTTRSGQQSAQDENAFLQAIAHPTMQQKGAARLLGLSDLLGPDALKMSQPEYLQRLYQGTKLSPGTDLQKLLGNADAVQAAMGLIGPGGANLARTNQVLATVGTSGTTAAANKLYQASPAAKFDDSVAAFKTSEQQFAEAALPLATAMTTWVTSGVHTLVDTINNWGKKTNTNPAGGTPGDTLTHLLTPGDPGFFNLTKAADEAARGTKDRGLFPSAGSFVDGVVNWLNHPSFGGGTGTAQAAGIITVPANYVGPLLPNERRAPGIVDSYRAPIPTIVDSYRAPVTPNLTGVPYAAINPMTVGGGPAGETQAQRQARFDAQYGPNALTRGGLSRPPDVTAATQRLAQAIANDTGKNTVESAFGLYRQTISSNPLLTAGTKAADILAQQAKVQRYERGAAGGPDQAAVSTTSAAYTLAQQMGVMPDKLKTIFEQYLEAERRLAIDTTKPGSAARAKALGSIAQQSEVFDYVQKSDAINRTLKDLQNQTAIDQALGNTGALGKDNAATLAYQTANAKFFKLDPSDLAVLAAQNRANLQATTSITNTNPFFQKQAGLGNFEAGTGSTQVRVGGVDPSVEAIRALERTIDALRAENSNYLAIIARNTGIRAASTASNPHHGGMS